MRTRPDAPTARPMFALVAGILLVVGTACGPTVPHQSGTAGAVAASPGAWMVDGRSWIVNVSGRGIPDSAWHLRFTIHDSRLR